MDEAVLDLIRNYMPEVQIERSPDIIGSYKIRLPGPVSETDGYKELRKALKESGVKPTCIFCHQGNTKFRYFDNNSSKVLQARYKCLHCNSHFTLGGKQYSKDQSLIVKDETDISPPVRRSKRFMHVDESEIEPIQTKRTRPWETATSRPYSRNIGSNIEFHPIHPLPAHQSGAHQLPAHQSGAIHPLPAHQSGAHQLPAHQSGAHQYPRGDFFQQQHQEQLGGFQQLPTQYLQPPPPTGSNLLQAFSSNAIELSPQIPAEQMAAVTVATGETSTFHDQLSNKDVQLVKSQELLQALTLPYMQPARFRTTSSDYSSRASGSNTSDRQRAGQLITQSNVNEDINASDELKALLNSPGRESSTDIWTLLNAKKKQQ